MDFLYISFSKVLIFLVLVCRSTQLIPASTDSELLRQKYGEIQHVSVIFRHGDRSPQVTYPLDPHRDYPWPGGFGQLLNKGKKRLFDLGQWFGERYSYLTGKEYVRERIVVQSSDIDRTIMSALSFLHGLYPANGSQEWLEQEKWQPIPVHTIPVQYDNIIFNDCIFCPRWMRTRQLHYASAESSGIFNEYNETIKYIEEHTGLNYSIKANVEILGDLDDLRDTLFIETQNNLTLPNWASKIFPEPLQTIKKKLKLQSGITRRKDVKIFAAGPILKSITSDMVRKVENPNFSQKVHIYSGHDMTIFRVLYALDAYPDNLEITGILPPYGSILIMELRRNLSDYFVTILYKSTTYGSPLLLQIPACGEVCSLEQFLQITKPLIPEDWNKECQMESGSVKMSLNLCSALITILMFLSR